MIQAMRMLFRIALGIGVLSFFSTTIAFAASVLNGGEQLTAEQYMLSPNKAWKLKMQGDGNLVLSREFDNRPIWATYTQFREGQGVKAVMQTDGNFVLYTGAGQPIWATYTQNNPGAKLKLQDDGNLVISSADNRALWATYTQQNNCLANKAWLSANHSWENEYYNLYFVNYIKYKFTATSKTFYGDSAGPCDVPRVVDKLEMDGRTYSNDINAPILRINKVEYNVSSISQTVKKEGGQVNSNGGSGRLLNEICAAYVTHRATLNGSTWTSISKSGTCGGVPAVTP